MKMCFGRREDIRRKVERCVFLVFFFSFPLSCLCRQPQPPIQALWNSDFDGKLSENAPPHEPARGGAGGGRLSDLRSVASIVRPYLTSVLMQSSILMTQAVQYLMNAAASARAYPPHFLLKGTLLWTQWLQATFTEVACTFYDW